MTFLSEFNFIKMRTGQFVNGTFKSMKLVRFNLLIIKFGDSISRWTSTGSNTDSGKGLKLVKIPESLLNQLVELNYQVEVQDHIHAQFQEKNNLPTCQCDSQEFDVSQLQIGVLKSNLGFQNNRSPGSNQ